MLLCSTPTKESVPGVLAGFSLAENPLCMRELGEHGVGCQERGCCWGRVTGSCVTAVSLLEGPPPAQKPLRG